MLVSVSEPRESAEDRLTAWAGLSPDHSFLGYLLRVPEATALYAMQPRTTGGSGLAAAVGAWTGAWPPDPHCVYCYTRWPGSPMIPLTTDVFDDMLFPPAVIEARPDWMAASRYPPGKRRPQSFPPATFLHVSCWRDGVAARRDYVEWSAAMKWKATMEWAGPVLAAALVVAALVVAGVISRHVGECGFLSSWLAIRYSLLAVQVLVVAAAVRNCCRPGHEQEDGPGSRCELLLIVSLPPKPLFCRIPDSEAWLLFGWRLLVLLLAVAWPVAGLAVAWGAPAANWGANCAASLQAVRVWPIIDLSWTMLGCVGCGWVY